MSDLALYHIVDEALEGTTPRPGCTCTREDRALIGCDCDPEPGGAYLPVTREVRDRANDYLAAMAARGFVPAPIAEVVRMASRPPE